MAGVKITRLIQTEDHPDSWIDLCGYGAIGGEVATKLTPFYKEKMPAPGSVTYNQSISHWGIK